MDFCWAVIRHSSRLVLYTYDIDTQISDIKFWKGDENLRTVYKKTVLRNIEWLLAFWTDQFQESKH
jgi:hypothetical protein